MLQWRHDDDEEVPDDRQERINIMTADTEAGFLTRVPPDPAPQGDDKRLHAALDSMRHRGLASIRSRVDPVNSPEGDEWKLTVWSEEGVWSRRKWRFEGTFTGWSVSAESLTVWSSADRAQGTRYVRDPDRTSVNILDEMTDHVVRGYLAALYCSRRATDEADLLGMPLVRHTRPTGCDLWNDNFAEERTFWCDEGSPVGLLFTADQWGSWSLCFADREGQEQKHVTILGEPTWVGYHPVGSHVTARLSRAALMLMVEEERERIARDGTSG